jgi:hypothetical protein
VFASAVLFYPQTFEKKVLLSKKGRRSLEAADFFDFRFWIADFGLKKRQEF